MRIEDTIFGGICLGAMGKLIDGIRWLEVSSVVSEGQKVSSVAIPLALMVSLVALPVLVRFHDERKKPILQAVEKALGDVSILAISSIATSKVIEVFFRSVLWNCPHGGSNLLMLACGFSILSLVSFCSREEIVQ